MTLYGYARVSVRELEDKNLDLQVERLVRAGLLELLDLVVEGRFPGRRPSLTEQQREYWWRGRRE